MKRIKNRLADQEESDSQDHQDHRVHLEALVLHARPVTLETQVVPDLQDRLVLRVQQDSKARLVLQEA